MTQSNAILAYLETGATLTPMEAFQMFGCLALHSRAAQLRNEGHLVACRIITLPNGKRVGQYFLERIAIG